MRATKTDLPVAMEMTLGKPPRASVNPHWSRTTSGTQNRSASLRGPRQTHTGRGRPVAPRTDRPCDRAGGTGDHIWVPLVVFDQCRPAPGNPQWGEAVAEKLSALMTADSLEERARRRA